MTTQTQAPRHIDQPADERESSARRHVQQLRVFYVHAAAFASSMAVIFTVNLLTNLSAGITREWSAWWSLWAFIGWGAGIAVHGLVVQINRPSFSPATWEQRQIDRILK